LEALAAQGCHAGQAQKTISLAKKAGQAQQFRH